MGTLDSASGVRLDQSILPIAKRHKQIAQGSVLRGSLLRNSDRLGRVLILWRRNRVRVAFAFAYVRDLHSALSTAMKAVPTRKLTRSPLHSRAP